MKSVENFISGWMKKVSLVGAVALIAGSVMVNAFANPIDEELKIEEWMTAPFESAILEEELIMETWMTSSWL